MTSNNLEERYYEENVTGLRGKVTGRASRGVSGVEVSETLEALTIVQRLK